LNDGGRRPISVGLEALAQKKVAGPRKVQTQTRARAGQPQSTSGDTGTRGGGRDLDGVLATEYENIHQYGQIHRQNLCGTLEASRLEDVLHSKDEQEIKKNYLGIYRAGERILFG